MSTASPTHSPSPSSLVRLSPSEAHAYLQRVERARQAASYSSLTPTAASGNGEQQPAAERLTIDTDRLRLLGNGAGQHEDLAAAAVLDTSTSST